jgi:hypothetical protein
MSTFKLYKSRTHTDIEERLCDKCTRAVIISGAGLNSERVYCYALPTADDQCGLVPIRVTSCNQYIHRNAQSIHDMRDQAWLIDINKKSTEVGFHRPGSEKARKLSESETFHIPNFD